MKRQALTFALFSDDCLFLMCMKGIYQRHAPVLLTMARGVWELRKSFAPRDGSQKLRNRFTDFYDFERVSVRGSSLSDLSRDPFVLKANAAYFGARGYRGDCCSVQHSRRPYRNLLRPPFPLPQVHNFLDGFYMSRIGIRILIGHYLALQVSDAPAALA